MGAGGSPAERVRISGICPPWLVGVAVSLASLVTASSPRADESTVPAPRPPFEAADISIGEPIPLPFNPPATVPAPATTPPPPVALPAPPPAVAAPAAAVIPSPSGTPPTATTGAHGNGWLGIVVAESSAPGRWTVDRVAAEGPAAAAGIRAGDEVRAINGLPLRNSDDVAQALTAIAPGQQVRLAVARDERVADVALTAIQRPPASRAWVTAATGQEVPPPATVPPPNSTAVAPRPTTPPASIPDVPPASFSPDAAAPQPEQRPASVAPAAPAAGFGSARGTGPVASFPPASPAEAAAGVRGRTALGVRTLPIDPDMQARFGLPEASGAYVIGVVGDLPASKAGVPPGSVIVAIDQQPVRSPDELTRLVTAGPIGRPVPLDYVLPGGTSRRAAVVLQSLERPLEQALLGEVGPTATPAPTLLPQSAPITARRPATASADAHSLRAEIRRLEDRIESLEQRLQAR